MKLLAAPKCLSDAVAPLVTLNYIVGFRIFEYPRGKLHTLLSLIYFLLLLGIFSVSIYRTHNFYQQIKLLKLEYILYESMVCMLSFVVMYEMVLGYFYTETINACYRKLAQIDETLRRFGLIINYNDMYFLSICVVFLWFLYILSSIIVTSVQLHTDLLTMILINVAQSYVINISFVIVFEFILFVRYLQTRLKLINELLSKGAAVSTTEEMSLFVTKDYVKIMDSTQRRDILPIKTFLRQVHLELYRVLKTLCTSFGIQITTEIGIAVILITVLLYNLYIVVIQRPQRAIGFCLVDQASVLILVTATNILKIIFINCACKHVINEGKKTSMIIHEIYGCCSDIDMREEIQQFDLQISLCPVEFFTFGICLNGQLLSTCLKTVTTYMVIMIQMSNSLESSRNS
ncbi:PREDICTED: uncharacterized protein LOC106751583 [Dinoponera quadriceps]|uniref:Gustatory receptor n=1 Tax=Dinoponera quadriceps TaxID=609295 RepID=A0A6P3YAI4_DINQU|nr:PREDICTED: uncharacterized protein LOC106751583 [Dinoponera quadriceps]